jgi:hypothetical protein
MPLYLKRVFVVFFLALVFAVVMYILKEKPFSFAPAAFAHGGETEIIQSVGDYKLEVAFVAPALVAREPVDFAFRILRGESTPVPFDLVVVHVSRHDNLTAFAAVLPQDAHSEGQASLRMALPEPGQHHFFLSFEKGGTKIAEATFVVQVEAPLKNTEAAGQRLWILALILGLAVGFGGAKLLAGRNRPKT